MYTSASLARRMAACQDTPVVGVVSIALDYARTLRAPGRLALYTQPDSCDRALRPGSRRTGQCGAAKPTADLQRPVAVLLRYAARNRGEVHIRCAVLGGADGQYTPLASVVQL